VSNLTRYLKHRWQAKSLRRVQSPFVQEFYREVLPHQKSEIGQKIEAFRKELSRSRERITFVDFGAGAEGKSDKIKSRLGLLAKRSARHVREGELLYRFCKHYQPRQCLELGTSLGISTMYQVAALPQSRFVSLEGASTLAQKAAANCLAVVGQTPEIVVGEFTESLNKLDWDNFRPDYVFIDGNHRYQATLDYFQFFLPRMVEQGMLIFDDINWSEGMRRAWQEICKHEAVTISLDLFSMGICFLRRSQKKEHILVPFRPR
jgi:predicted O-methyltransferase YrrM